MRGYDDADEPIRQGLDLGELEEDEVKSIIQRELENALGNNDGDLARQRQEALRYYDGEKFGNEVDGRSEVVMRSVLEAVEWVLPALLRIFTASDQICLIEPNQPGSEDKAKRATQYINWIFYRDNAGFMVLHDWFKDALLEKVGWVKYWWDTQEETETKSYEALTREQYDALLGQDADVEVVKESKYTQEVDSFLQDRPQPPPPLQPPLLPGMPPIPVPPLELYDCTLRITRDNGRARIEGVPPEQMRFSPRARRGDIPFISHVVQWTYSDLLEQGYDADTLDEVPFDDTMDWNTERRERYGKEAYTLSDERSDSAREIWVEESYIQLALGKSKTTELYKVTTAGAGKVILTKGGKPDIECVEEAPFVSICPIPRPHALVGNSLADLTMDIQLIKSTLMRQMLDNAYLSNWPRMEIGDDVVNENTYDDMLTHRPGGMVRTRRLGGIQALAVPYTADKTFGLIEYLDQTQEVRTGVARHNQGINPDDLNKTATGVVAPPTSSSATSGAFCPHLCGRCPRAAARRHGIGEASPAAGADNPHYRRLAEVQSGRIARRRHAGDGVGRAGHRQPRPDPRAAHAGRAIAGQYCHAAGRRAGAAGLRQERLRRAPHADRGGGLQAAVFSRPVGAAAARYGGSAAAAQARPDPGRRRSDENQGAGHRAGDGAQGTGAAAAGTERGAARCPVGAAAGAAGCRAAAAPARSRAGDGAAAGAAQNGARGAAGPA